MGGTRFGAVACWDVGVKSIGRSVVVCVLGGGVAGKLLVCVCVYVCGDGFSEQLFMAYCLSVRASSIVPYRLRKMLASLQKVAVFQPSLISGELLRRRFVVVDVFMALSLMASLWLH